MLQFLIAFLIFGGMLACVFGFIYLLVNDAGIGVFSKPNWKEKWFTYGEYTNLSTKDKLKYHKYKGDTVEKLELKYSLATLVTMKYRDLEILYKIKKEDGKYFFLDKYSKLSFDNPELKTVGMNRICFKLDNGKIVELWTDNRIGHFAVSINLDRLGSVGFVSDYDNIIKWESLLYRDEVLEALKKLDVNLEEKLVW